MENNKLNKNLIMKILFFATSEFGAIVLEKLAHSIFKPILVVTTPDKPKNREKIITPPPAKIAAQKLNIEIKQPQNLKSYQSEIEKINPDLIIVASYGKILPKEILEIPQYGCLNIHPSLLPKYRGPSPIQNTILNGDKETGITIILMDEQIDHGPIISSLRLTLRGKEKYSELEKKLAEKSAELLIETIPKWMKKEIKPQPQNHKEATFTKLLKKEDGHIKWSKTAEEIERQIRAYEKWPQTYSILDGKILKILESSVKILPIEKNYPYGKLVVSPEKEILVATKQNYLKLEKMQIEGKKPVNPKEFINGYYKFIGSILK